MKLFLVGGFLGSGKTTAIKNACLHLMENDVAVTVITNDQGALLVDTGFIKSFNIPVEEVSNGCFCCNYDQLTYSLQKINKSEKPQIVFAEAVGSCTDLIATVTKPLKIFHPDTTAVISVFADASLLSGIISGDASFVNESVQYLYKKQLEEADILIINKVDLLTAQQLKAVQDIIQKDYTNKTVLYQNSLDEKSIEQWLETANKIRLPAHRQSLQINYDVYAEGEAVLGWLDEAVKIVSNDGLAYSHALQLTDKIEACLREQFAIGHVKFLIDDGKNKTKLSYTTINHKEEREQADIPKVNKVSLLINARVEATPELLKKMIEKVIEETIKETKADINIASVSAFQPGYPTPKYRFVY